MINDIQQTLMGTTNYLVPAAGNTHAVKFGGTFSATPFLIDWRQFRVDNFPFQPQGVFIDNTNGTADLVINIQPIDYNVTCAVGQTLSTQFPAPNGQTCSITGSGEADIIFVDFPVLPDANQVSVKGVVNMTLAGIATADVLNVQMAALSQGAVPYQVIEFPVPAQVGYVAVAAAATTGAYAPAAGSNLRRLFITLSGDATLAAAGTIFVTGTLNGTQVFKRTLYIPGAASGNDRVICDLEFNGVGVAIAGGSFSLNLSAALATGTVEANAYFTPQ